MNGEVAVEVPSQNGKIKERFVADLSVRGDLPNGRADDCNGVETEGAVGEIENESGKGEVDGVYVLINGSDIASEEDQSVQPDPIQDFAGNSGELKVNGCNGYCDSGESATGEGDDAVEDYGDHENGNCNTEETAQISDSVADELKTGAYVNCSGESETGVEEDGVGDHGDVTHENGYCNTEEQAQISGPVANELKAGAYVNCSGESSTGVEEEDGVGGHGDVTHENGSCYSEEQLQINGSVDELDVVESDVLKQVDGTEVVLEEQDMPGAVYSSVVAVDTLESRDRRNGSAPTLSDGKESETNAGEISDLVDEVPKSEQSFTASVNPDLHEDLAGCIDNRDENLTKEIKIEPNVVVEDEESLEIQPDSVKSDLDLGKELTESVVPPFSEGSLEGIHGDSDPNVQAAIASNDPSEADKPDVLQSDDNSHGLQPTLPEPKIAVTTDEVVTALIENEHETAPTIEEAETPTIDKLETALIENEHETAPAVDEPETPTVDNLETVLIENEHETAPKEDEPETTTTDDSGTSLRAEPDTATSAGEPGITPSARETETALSAGETETALSAGETETDPSACKQDTTGLWTTVDNDSETDPTAYATENATFVDEPVVAPVDEVKIEALDSSQEAEEQSVSRHLPPSADCGDVPFEAADGTNPDSDAQINDDLVPISEPIVAPVDEVKLESLNTSQETEEQSVSRHLPSSVYCGNVPFEAADGTHPDSDAQIDDNLVPIVEIEKADGEMTALLSQSVTDSETGASDLSVVDNEISTSLSVSNMTSAICFGSIGLSELSVISTDDRNSGFSSAVHASVSPPATSEETKSTEVTVAECADVLPKNDASVGVVGSKQPNMIIEVEKRFFNYLIRVPRYDGLKEDIATAQSLVDEKTRIRDAIGAVRKNIKALRDEYDAAVKAAIEEEKAAREPLKSKLKELDQVKLVLSLDDMNARIQNMEHTIGHVTMDLKEEKQLMREIKQLRLAREQFSSNVGNEELKQMLEQKEHTEERFKILRKEAELLRDNVSRAELVTKAAKKKLYDENVKVWELKRRFEEADSVRQDTYMQLRKLRKQLDEKNKHFWKYRNDGEECINLLKKKDLEAVSQTCMKQVEDFIEMLIQDSEYRDSYIRCNARSTLRRLGTRDGRALGPNEEPPNIPSYSTNGRAAIDSTFPPLPNLTKETPALPLETCSAASETSAVKPVEQQKNQDVSKAAMKTVKASSESHVVASLPVREELLEVAEEAKRVNEEEEMAGKAEELRKEEEEAKLKEQRHLEEKAKAEAALERKKRSAERAQARAAAKAQKEAEQKEKEREKRLKKKEKKRVGENVGADTSSEVVESTPSAEAPGEAPPSKELDTRDRSEVVTRRHQRPSHFTKKQNKINSIPPPLRNRGKRKMQHWMWVMAASALLVLSLLFLGNGRNFLRLVGWEAL